MKRYFAILLLSAFVFSFQDCQPNQHQEGERLYQKNCANCHMENGEGLNALIPPLTDSVFLDKNRDRLPCILRYGLKDSIVVNGIVYSEEMKGVAALTDIHITNILNYIDHTWGRNQKPFQLEEVQQMLDKCKQKGQF